MRLGLRTRSYCDLALSDALSLQRLETTFVNHQGHTLAQRHPQPRSQTSPPLPGLWQRLTPGAAWLERPLADLMEGFRDFEFMGCISVWLWLSYFLSKPCKSSLKLRAREFEAYSYILCGLAKAQAL